MRTVTKLAAALAVSACVFSTAGRAADDTARLTATVDGAFRPLLEKYDVPGIAVAVTLDGRQFFFNYGVASKEKKTPVTRDTLFEIGSVSKTFTATLFGLAQTRGKVSLDDHPGKFMPELRDSAIDRATLLNLGTFTAGGLPLQIPGAVKDKAEMIAYFQQWKPAAAPGVQRRYSNPSIGLFGYVTALAMHGDFASLVESEVIAKLGLTHSYIHVPATAMPRYAWGYNKAGQPVRVNPGVFDAEAYGIKSSAADLIRYVEANIRTDTLDTPMRRAIEATHVGYFKVGEMVQGLGWEQYPYPVTLARLLAGNADTMATQAQPVTPVASPGVPSAPTLYNKTGSTGGFGAYVAFVPEKRIGVVMLANRNVPIPARVTAVHAVLAALAAQAPQP